MKKLFNDPPFRLVLGGVRDVAFPTISSDSTKQSLLFSNFIGSLYFRSIPFSDYLERVISSVTRDREFIRKICSTA